MILWTLLAFLACKPPSDVAPVAASPVAAPEAVKKEIAPAPGDDAVMATWDGGTLNYGEVRGEIDMSLIQMQSKYLTDKYDAESAAIDNQVSEALLESEAKKRGVDVPALLKAEVEAKSAAPTEAEVQELFNANARKLRGKTLDEVRPDVEKAVLQRKQSERYMAYVTELRASYNVAVKLPYPDLPRVPVSADDDPTQGPASAQITIIQFAEFQCPYCGKAREATDAVLKNYEGKVRFVFRDFPLGFHDRAIPAAVAANCAGKQDRYWQVHDAFMANQRALEEADFEKAARDAGVNIADWQACRQDPAMEAEIRKDMADGDAAGVTGTPAFFINGVFINGAQPYEKFKAIIDRELQAKG